jgi:hypothetical protein
VAIVHDAWLFQPTAFADAVFPYARSVVDDPVDGYRELRAAALAGLDRCHAAWSLLDRYGGWDRASLLSELPESYPGGPEPVALGFTLLLYTHLADNNGSRGSLGVHTSWRPALDTLERFNWGVTDRELLIKGHRFAAFVDRYLVRDGLTHEQAAEARRIWQHVRPASTAGWAGWLDRADVSALLRTLKATKETGTPGDGFGALVRAETMLQTASANDQGLCLILSG